MKNKDEFEISSRYHCDHCQEVLSPDHKTSPRTVLVGLSLRWDVDGTRICLSCARKAVAALEIDADKEIYNY